MEFCKISLFKKIKICISYQYNNLELIQGVISTFLLSALRTWKYEIEGFHGVKYEFFCIILTGRNLLYGIIWNDRTRNTFNCTQLIYQNVVAYWQLQKQSLGWMHWIEAPAYLVCTWMLLSGQGKGCCYKFELTAFNIQPYIC